jgi:HEPN domain-containing protein
MVRRTEEWLRQADYDIDAAEYMYQGGRYVYAVFMCHLAIEKALKAFTPRSSRGSRPNPIAWFFFYG